MSNHLSFDLMIEIFSWLPVHSLLRFRGVCKSWYNSITEIDRIKHHHPAIMFACPTRSLLYSFDCTGEYSSSAAAAAPAAAAPAPAPLDPLLTVEIDCPFNRSQNAELKILASCNGLLCVRLASDSDFNKYNVICLWNPSTTEFKRLPDEPLEYPPGVDSTTIDRRAVYGLGCNRTMNNDYKLIRILLSDDESGVQFASEVVVYSLRTNSWKTISNILLEQILPNGPPAPYIRGLDVTAGVHVNGALHWITAISSPRYYDKNIVSFEIGDESFRVVRKPDTQYIHTYETSLNVLRECLGLLVVMFTETICVDVWIMKEYGVKDSWTLLFRCTNVIPQNWNRLKLLWLGKNGELLLQNRQGDEIVFYDLKSDEVKIFDINRHVKKNWFHTEMYVVNPISLKSS